MKKIYSGSALIICISALFICLFTYAAISKIRDFEAFQVQLGKSPVITVYAHFFSWTVPMIEILISILFLFNHFRTLALYASFTLMVAFTTYIIMILNFSAYVPCSCGGVLQNMTWSQHLVFNILFILLSIIAILFAQTDNKSLLRIRGDKPKTLKTE